MRFQRLDLRVRLVALGGEIGELFGQGLGRQLDLGFVSFGKLLLLIAPIFLFLGERLSELRARRLVERGQALVIQPARSAFAFSSSASRISLI